MAAIDERAIGTGDEPAALRFDFARTGRGTLAGEYLRRFWQPVAVANQLPAGRAKPMRIIHEDYTLYRGETGQAHVVAFRCAHRGTQLSTGWVEGDEIRCFYHGWKYDGAGQCTEQPAEPEPFCNRIKIKSYPTEEYLGLIWTYLGDGETPPLRRFPQWEEESDTRLRTNRGGRVAPYNYANIMENDPAHVPFVHRETRFFTDIPYVSAIEMDYGSRETVKFQNREGYVHRIMPNGRSFVTPVQDVPGGWTENLIFQVPVDDETHLGFGIQLHHIPADAADTVRKQFGSFPGGQGRNPQADIAASVLRGEMTLDDVEDRQFIVNLQDLVSQWGQGTIRDHTQDRLGRSDAGVIMLRRLWERELRNLAEEKPLKEWAIPERIELTADYHG